MLEPMTSSFVLRYFHTLRHLKSRQMVFQLIRRLSRPSLPQRRGPVNRRAGVHLKPGIPRTMALADEFAFRFLNEERRFSQETIDWQAATAGKLWRYNLHYFDYLHEKGRTKESIRILIDSWIAANSPGTVDAWEPFPLSLRIVNWIKYFLSPGNQSTIAAPWLVSLYDQALWLEQSIEYHLLANHYFKNGKALIFAGLYFTGNDADRWLRKGLKIVSDELDEQILPDGGHFERSPMYHSMILEDCLDLYNLCAERPERQMSILAGRLRGVVPRMLSFLLGMTHPDEEIALFNDAAFGIEPNSRQLAEYSAHLTGILSLGPEGQAWAFPETGFFVLAPRKGDRLIVDCGPVGPNYQPGHAHCDTLSFELSLRGRRVIVDSGCCRYLADELRTYQRGNAGHNTVTVDNLNQSEVWGAHRCARRARPLSHSLERLADGALRFVGGHDGYRRLPGKPVHLRSVTWRDNNITIVDQVEGGGSHAIELRLHINPDLSVGLADGKAVIRDYGSPLAAISAIGDGRIEMTPGNYCPEFGRILSCPVLLITHPSAKLPFRGGWSIDLL